MKIQSIENKGWLIPVCDSVNICIAYILVYNTLVNCLVVLSDFMGGIKAIADIIYLLLFLNALPSIMRNLIRLSPQFYIFIFLFFSTYLLSWMISSDMELHRLIIQDIMLYCVEMLLLGISIRNFEDIVKKMKFSAIAILILYALYYEFLLPLIENFGYSQEIGYDCLLAFSLFYILFFVEQKKRYLIIAALALFLMFASGSRGPLLCSAIIALLGPMFSSGKSMKKYLRFIGVLGVISFVLFVFGNDILSSLNDSFERNGLSTRTTEKLMDKSINEDSGRKFIKNVSNYYINDHLLWGTGIGNDRIVIYQEVKGRDFNSSVYGSYSHNFFIELMMQFGLFPGLLLGVIFLFFLYKSIISCKDYKKVLLVVSLAIGFLPLLVSRSYVTFSPFYFLIGILFCHFNNDKKNKIVCALHQ